MTDLDESRMGYHPPLRPAERQLLDSIGTGEQVVPLAHRGPAPHPSHVRGWRGRAVRASVIASAVAGTRTGASFQGIRLAGALIEGALDLSWAELHGPLVLEGCRITDRVLLGDARAKELVLVDCHLAGGLEAPRLVTDGRVDLSGSYVADLEIYDARLGGDLLLSRAKVDAVDGQSIDAGGAHVGADVAMDDGFQANGLVSLAQSRVTRSVTFNDAELEATGSWTSLKLDGAQIEGDLTCRCARVTAENGTALNATAIKVTGGIDCSGACLTAKELAIVLDTADVGASIALSVAIDAQGSTRRLEAHGSVRMNEIKVGKQLNCRGALFDGQDQPAFLADNAEILGSVSLAWAGARGTPLVDAQGLALRCEAYGPVSFRRSKLRTSLICSGGRFTNPEEFALDLYGATIEGDALFEAPLDSDMQLVEDPTAEVVRFEALGTVRLHGARVRGALSFRGAVIAAEVTALDGRMLDVGMNVQFDPQRNRAGTVLDSQARSARFEVGSYVGVSASPVGFEERGLVQLIGADIAGDVNFQGARLTAEAEDLAVEAPDVEVGHAFVWRDVDCVGRVKLRNSKVGVLEDELASWATGKDVNDPALDIDHFTYQSIAHDTGWKDRRTWLKRQVTYSPQPYSLLAQVYRRVGDEESARKISMERVNEQVRRRGYKRRDPRKLLRWLIKNTIGHGYEPWRALYWAAGLWAVAWVMIALALCDNAVVATRASANTGAPSPTNCERMDYPCLTPPLLAADLVVPVVTLGQRDYWRVNGALGYRVGSAVLIVAGWVLTTMVVAGFTGLVRRE